MFNKTYEKIKQFMKENKLTLLFYLIFIVVMTYKLPFFIYTGGGVIDTDKRIEIENSYKTSGNFYFAYVSSLNATIPTYLLAHIIPSWDIEPIDSYQINEEEDANDITKRDKLYLEEASTAAIFNAYNLADKEIKIDEEKLSVIYIEDKEKSELKIGDVIKKINNIEIKEFEDIKDIVTTSKVGETLKLEIKRDNKNLVVDSTIFQKEGTNFLGISVLKTYDYTLNPELKLKFKSRESGPSGGLALALTIYNKLVSEDITKGKKIVVTGTIDTDGNVGSIGGVTYKLRGAIKEKADIFIVPNEDNYKEVMEVVNKERLNIKVIGVDTFKDAVDKLSQVK